MSSRSVLSSAMCQEASNLLLLHGSLESREQLEDVFAHAGFSAFAWKRPKQGGDPGLLPGRRHGAAAAAAATSGQTGAAGASQGLVVVLAAGGREPASALLRWEVFGEEAAVVSGAGRAEGTRRAGVSEHAGLVAVIRHGAPEAAVAGDAQAVAADGGAQRGVGGVAEAVVV